MEVFIIGCPRSGTTYLMQLLASNKAFAWVSNELNSDPFKYELSIKLKEFDKIFVGKRRYLKSVNGELGYPTPVEPWNFWNHHFPFFQWKEEFCEVARNAVPDDARDKDIDKVRNAIKQICEFSGKNIFLSKYTDFPRIQLIRKAFPNAKFIHIVRDGRAVANSYYKKIESGEFKTSKEEMNWVKAWPQNWQEDYLNKNRSTLAFTLYQWKFFLDQIQSELLTIPTNEFIEIKYSDLTSNTKKTTNRILDFIGVQMDENMNYFIKNIPGSDRNFKWQERLSEEEKMMFTEIVTEERFLKYLGN